MATFIVLANFTDQGIHNIQDSTERLGSFKEMAAKLGVTLKSVHYTVGDYDIIAVVEGSDEGVTAALLKLGSLGNVRTRTLRAFSPEEFKTIVSRVL
jgi:uncharacterized protein with GYD domain